MKLLVGLFADAVLGVLAGCGGSGGQSGAPPQTTAARTTTSGGSSTGTTTSASGPGALQAEATSAAAGDIPDNQVFLVFRNGAGYSLKYPEGWAEQGTGGRVTFRDKNNIARVVVAAGSAPTLAGVRADVAGLSGVHVQSPPQAITVSGSSAFKVVYSSESSPNAVTGKRVKLVVDRYYLWHGGRRAVVDLGTPEGVDNVDAYRLMIESFRWK
jgi:hypothetical protein